MASAEEVVRAYDAVVGSTGSTVDDLRAVLTADFRLDEHPNALSPRGSVRDLDTTVAGFLAGKGILTEQRYDLRDVVASGDRVAVKAAWTGTLARDLGGLAAGTTLRADIASFLLVRDGRIAAQETFDCYEPLG